MGTSTTEPTTQSALAAQYRTVRDRTDWLCEPLVPEDQVPQSAVECSPIKWHRAHTTWFFETFLLRPLYPEYQPLNERYIYLFNSYYNAVGDQYARPNRGHVTRPTVGEVSEYRRYVDRHMLVLLAGEVPSKEPVPPAVVALGLHHEQQHQELMVTDLKHLWSFNPLYPVYREGAADRWGGGSVPRWGGVDVPEGVHEIGFGGTGFCYDNETPRHRVFLEPCEIAGRLITAGEYLAFMEDRGYDRPELWLADGWTAVRERGWNAPLYWAREADGWWSYTLSGYRRIDPAEPVTHISHFEADAYARWAGARLPTEAEWEVATAALPIEGNFVDDAAFHPVPLRGEGEGLRQAYGDVWEWTQSAYLPYPGYDPPDGALGEYNGKFMSGQIVLRGGSCATARSHIRGPYRNFFYPDARWQFSGIRLARS